VYNFKIVDYKLSKQEYIFKFLSTQDEGKYNFVYVPYSEFPALLMLDYILATNPHEFNVDIFNYFSEMGQSEKYSDGDILVLSEGLNSKEGYINKLGIYKKDYYPSQTKGLIGAVKEQAHDKGSVLELSLTEGKFKIVDLFKYIGSQKIGGGTVKVGIDNFLRENIILSTLISEKYLGDRKDWVSADFLSIKHTTRDSSYVEFVSGIQVYKEDEKIEVHSSINSYLGDNRVGNFINIFGVNRVNTYETVLHEGIYAKVLNQFNGVIIDGDLYTRDYLFSNMSSISTGLRDIVLKSSVFDFTFAQRYSYIYSEIIFDDLFTERKNEFKGHKVHTYDYIKYSSFVLDYTEEYSLSGIYTEIIEGLHSKKDLVCYGFLFSIAPYQKEVYTNISELGSFNKISGDKGIIEFVSFLNKETGVEVSIETPIFSTYDAERLAGIEYLLNGIVETDRRGELFYSKYSIIPKNRFGYTVVGGWADRYKENRAVRKYIFTSEDEGMGPSIIFDVGDLNREDGSLSIITSHLMVDYENESMKDSDFIISIGDERSGYEDIYYISGINTKDRNTQLMGLDVGVRSDKRYSHILLVGLTSDKEKDADQAYNWFSDKDIDSFTNYFYHSGDRIFSPIGFLKYGIYSFEERQHEAIVDFTSRLGSIDLGKHAFIDNYISTSSRDMSGKGVIEGLFFTDLDAPREGRLEFVLDVTKPRKKLLKSWLEEVDRDLKKDMFLEGYVEGVKRTTRGLVKYTPDLYKRAIQKNITMQNDLTSAGIKRINKLDIGARKMDGSVPIQKDMDRTNLLDGLRYKKEPLLKYFVEDHDYEKDGVVDYTQIYSDKFKDAFIENQISSQSLMYDYSRILKEGMQVEHWEVGYAIPENYDPKDPFNAYYPWAEERNTYSIVQESQWERVKGDWTINKGKAEIISKDGEGLLVVSNPYEDFKFKFCVTLGYEPQSRVGFVFRYKDILNYYKVSISPGSNPIELVQLIDGRERKVASPIAPFFMEGESIHYIDLSCVGDRLVIYLDGRLQYDILLEG